MHAARFFALMLALTLLPLGAVAQNRYDFEVDTTRSLLTLRVELEVVGEDDSDEVSSRLSGSISGLLTPVPASFSEIHIDSMQIVFHDELDIDFDFGFFVGELEINAAPGEVLLSLSEPGDPSAVSDTSFLQEGNAFQLTGTLGLDTSGPLDLAGLPDEVDLDTELRFDIPGTISEFGETVELRIPLAITDTTEIEGNPLILQIDGIVYATGVQVSTDTEVDELPAAIALDQNYPNPFNPRTSIRFALSEPAYATLQIYDALGRLVTTLVDGTLPAGEHEATFDAAGYPSGVYVYRLTANGREEHRTMVLLR